MKRGSINTPGRNHKQGALSRKLLLAREEGTEGTEVRRRLWGRAEKDGVLTGWVGWRGGTITAGVGGSGQADKKSSAWENGELADFCRSPYMMFIVEIDHSF